MRNCVLLALLLVAPSLRAEDKVSLDANLSNYKPASGIAGANLETVGSDTMNNMLGLWTEEFKKMYPSIKPAVDGKGSSNAIPALIAGKASFGPMSREPKAAEIKEFKDKFGYEPTILPTSIDMLAVYVNKDNPVTAMNYEQIDAVFSSTRKMGGKAQLRRWASLAASGPISSKSITCYGRNASSGTYGYFKDVVLGSGDYGKWVGELPGSAGVVQAVGGNLGGIGYSGIGYRTADVRPLAIAAGDISDAVEPVPANAYNGSYPLSRFLYLAVNYNPTKPLDPMRAEFIKFVYSQQGQSQVIKDGYLPVSAEIAAEALESVGLKP